MFNDAIKREIQKLFETSESPELGPGPRPGIKSEGELQNSLDECFGNSEMKAERHELIRALVLLWHDHLDAAHKIAQDIGSADGAFVHGIMHRREPDYGNAAYWFRRVGEHPAFREMARSAREILKGGKGARIAERLMPDGNWDPFALIGLCEEVSGRSGSYKGSGTKLPLTPTLSPSQGES